MASLFTDSLTTLPAQTDSYGFVGYVTDSSVGRHLVFMAAYKKKAKREYQGARRLPAATCHHYSGAKPLSWDRPISIKVTPLSP